NRQGQRAAALTRGPRQAARACVCGRRHCGHAVSADDGRNAGGLQALTGQGVVTVVIENAELVTVAAPLELALTVQVPVLSMERFAKLAIPLTGRTVVVPLNVAPVEFDSRATAIVPVKELSVLPRESRTTTSTGGLMT